MTGIRRIVGGAAALMLVMTGGAWAQSTLFGITGDGATNSEELNTLSLVDAALTFVSSLGNGDDGEVLVFNPNDGQFYHFSGRGSLPGGVNDNANGSIFERIDPTTGAVTPVGFAGNGFDASSPGSFSEEALAAAYNPFTGNFLVTDLDDNLYSVTTGGQVTFLANVGFSVKGLAFLGNQLLATEQSDGFDNDGEVDLMVLDPTTGAVVSSVNITLAGVNLTGSNGLSLDPQTGELYAIVRENSSTRYLVRVDPATGQATMIGLLSDNIATIAFNGFFSLVSLFQQSLVSAGLAVFDAADFLTNLPLNGAHHVPLLLQRGLEKHGCAWLTGDFGEYRQHDTSVQLVEVGVCHDFFDDKVRVGLGIGQSFVDQDLHMGGENDMDGQYAILELGIPVSGLPLVATINAMVGSWDANIDRRYLSGTVQTSRGETDVTTRAFRIRLDYTGIEPVSGLRMTPRVSFTLNKIEVDAYSETGGNFAARFDDVDETTEEVRAGFDLAATFGERLRVTGLAEVVHRFDDELTIDGSVGPQTFSFVGPNREDTWARVGLGAEYRINDRFYVSAHGNVSTDGQDAQTSGGIGVRLAF